MMQPMVTRAAGGDAPFLGAKHRGDRHVLGRTNHAVGLHDDPAAQVVEHQHLVRFGQAQFPGRAGVLDRRLRAGAGAAVVAADQHHVGLALGHARGHGADADFGHQLDADARLAIRVFQIVDQLREIFDRINVVVRRRRDQAHARRAVADAGDFLIDFVAGQLAPLAGLGPLGHLDLQLLGADQVFAGHAEAAAGHLLDGATAAVAVGVGLEADRVFAPFARVALAADAVHGDRQRLVRFARDRAVRHRAGGKSLDDVDGRLDFVQRNGLFARLELEQPAQRQQLPLLLVDQLAELAKLLAAVQLRRVLQLGDHVGAENVGFALATPLVLAADVQIERLRHFVPRISVFVTPQRFLGNLRQPDALDAAGRAGEILVDESAVETDRFENLRAAVALLRRDAHFRHHFQDALHRRFDKVLLQLLVGECRQCNRRPAVRPAC